MMSRMSSHSDQVADWNSLWAHWATHIFVSFLRIWKDDANMDDVIFFIENVSN